MAFVPTAVFPGELFDVAERYAKDSVDAAPDAGIIEQMGWAAILVPEADGGFGGRFEDLGSLIDALASRATNLPVITRCGVTPAILSAAPSDSPAGQLRARIAAGEVSVEFCGPLSKRESDTFPSISKTAGGLTLSGVLTDVEPSGQCSHALLHAIDAASGQSLIVLLAAEALRNLGEAYVTVEGRHIRSVTLEQHRISDDAILARGEAAEAMRAAGWQIAQASMATDIVCTMNYALGETVRYLQERKQFGQPLSQFQVLRHDVAKLYVTYESCRCLLMSSLRALQDASHPSERDASFDLLGLYVREHAIEFAQAVIQLHGGMGMTQETLAARMATRLTALAFRFGDAGGHLKALREFQGASVQ